jgi:signal peptidase I
MKTPRRPDRLGSLWREWIKPLLTILLVMGAIRSSLADWNDVPTGSMIPSICEGDRIFVNKLAYDLKVPFTTWRLARWGDPQRGDVVVCFSPHDGKRLVKRVIGLPGDVVAMEPGRLIVNGSPLPVERRPANAYPRQGLPADTAFADETLGHHTHPITISPSLPSRPTFGPVRVPAGQYFVMGDNRDNSFDSRFFGSVDRDAILGEALAIVLSFDPRHCYLPRWSRFFRALR